MTDATRRGPGPATTSGLAGTATKLGRGAVAGLAATLAMSAVMLGARRLRGEGEPGPEIVTQRALGQAGASVGEGAEHALATVAHLAYGCSAGALFGLARPWLPLDRRLRGPLFGLALGVAGYEGWVPALGLFPPLHEQRRERRVPLLAAHLVYGWVLGALAGGGPR